MLVLAGKKVAVAGVSLSADGRWVTAAYRPGGADLFDRRTGRVAGRFNEPRGLTGAAVHPDGRMALVWGTAGLLAVSTATFGSRWVEPRGTVTAAGVSADGRRVVGVVATGSGPLFVGWKVHAGRNLAPDWQARAADALAVPFALAPGGELFAVQKYPAAPVTTRVMLRSAADGRLIRGADAPAAGLLRLLDSGLAVLGRGVRLITFDAVHGRKRAEVRFKRAQVAGAAPTPDGRRVVAATRTAAVVLTADPLAVEREYTFPVAGGLTCVAVSPDGLTAAAGTAKGQVVVWDLDG